jgi:high-affinity iron transporter
MSLIHAAGLLGALLSAGTATVMAVPPTAPQGDLAPTVRRIAGTATLAAQEYAIGIKDGKVVAAAEVEEARLFLTEARRTAGLLPPDAGRTTIAQLDALIAMVGRLAPPDSISAGARQLAADLAGRFNVSLDEVPSRTPSMTRGAEVYRAQCALCHGPAGRGDGPSAAELNPVPADLTDFRNLAGTTPLDFYRRITIGVAGTSMPAYESQLSPEDRWSAAVYATALRYPAARGEVPAGLREFATTSRMGDSALAAALAPGADPAAPDVRGRIAAVRAYGTAGGELEAGLVFQAVRRQLDSAVGLARAGQGESASERAFDAYMSFEQVERSVRAKNPALAGALEAGFAALRTRAAGGATPAELATLHAGLLADLEKAERAIGDRLSPFNLFLQSLVLLLREGLEAILVVGAVVAFLLKMGAGHRRRDIHVGVALAIGASLLTALLLETIFQVSRASQEVLEGGVMLVATAMLFYVSYWLLSKMEVAKWNRFVKSRVQDAVTSGSALALASVAFLAVYREGFETVLFYKALFLAGAGSVLPVVSGMVVGGAVLGLVYYAINRWGVRIPLKPFFAVTSVFLYYMAFVFAGKGVAELQEGGVIATTVLPWAPRIPGLGIYPTVESLALQGLLLLLLVFGLVWTFVVEPRRLKVTSTLVPEPEPETERPAAPVERPLRVESDMIRSLNRMDADLAELRAEVERLKALLLRSARAPGSQD